jgi:hypothetical protein
MAPCLFKRVSVVCCVHTHRQAFTQGPLTFFVLLPQSTVLQDHEQALERERAAAASRLREACERYEGQMQTARMRLMADTGEQQWHAAAAVLRMLQSIQYPSTWVSPCLRKAAPDMLLEAAG